MITARAINANGWIAGDSSGAGWVLIPWDDYRTNYCAADLAGSSLCPDGVVDVFDLFALLSNWNTSGLGADLASSTSVVVAFGSSVKSMVVTLALPPTASNQPS